MNTLLPNILSAGHFDSNQRLPNIKKTHPRTVKCFEVEFFQGDGGYSVINGTVYPVKKGNVLFAKPDDIRYSILPFNCDFLHFDSLPKEILNRFELMPSVFQIEDFPASSELLIKIIKHYCSADRIENISASAELLLLLKEISIPNSKENSIASKARKFIHNNYMDDITVESIAEYCCVSSSYLHKIFSKTYSIGPAEAILNRRIYKAKELIINTSLPISEIAATCGFNSQSYFSDCFKRKNGTSPGEFRRCSSYLLKY